MKLLHNRVSLYIWNISNPSLERAMKQCEWLKTRSEDIYILTEAKNSSGCRYIYNYLSSLGYKIDFKYSDNKNDYGLIVASSLNFDESSFISNIQYLAQRVSSITVNTGDTLLEIISTYIPSRNASIDKIKRKQIFIKQLEYSLEKVEYSKNRILCGDFNILEPNHHPKYNTFKKWEYEFYNNLPNFNLWDCFRYLYPNKLEYSWFGKTGNGYRYDHAFCSKELLTDLNWCFYDHSVRTKKLSDHSALSVGFNKNFL